MKKISNSFLDKLQYRSPQFEASSADAGIGKEQFESDARDPYQRDLGRIVHSASFRRLQTKTQVMGSGEGDFHRTRLTHSLEVAQIGRGIVWKIQNIKEFKSKSELKKIMPSSELIEAICYAHDLGHPPFGHAGEQALQSKMYDKGGFEGNAQTIRLLTKLEKMFKNDGIRPTRRLLLGALKYPVPYSKCLQGESKPPKCHYDDELDIIRRALEIFSSQDIEIFLELDEKNETKYKTFDCSIMEMADDIAYGVHDLEDGIARGLLRRSELESDIKKIFKNACVDKVRELTVEQIIEKLFSDESHHRKHAISLLVGFFIISVKVDRYEKFENPLLDYRVTVDQNVNSLLKYFSKEITFNRIVKRREVQTLEIKGKRIISDLFQEFEKNPFSLIGVKALNSLNSTVIKKYESEKEFSLSTLDADEQKIFYRAICDFIAGMTNPYAEKYHRRLFEPGFGSSTDEL